MLASISTSDNRLSAPVVFLNHEMRTGSPIHERFEDLPAPEEIEYFKNNTFNHKHYNFLDCDLAKLLTYSLVIEQLNKPITFKVVVYN